MGFRKRYILLIMLFIIAVYLFWGPLFPWFPLKAGYDRIETDKAVLYIEGMSERDSVAFDLQRIIAEEEEFHGLEYKKRFRIIIPDPGSNMKRFTPWLRGTGMSVSLGFGNVVYIGPSARRSAFGIETYIKHELSHMLLHHNTVSKSDALKMHRQGWLTEGLAIYFGGPIFYTLEDFAKACRESGIGFDSLLEAKMTRLPLGEIRLRYAYYGYFVQFLDETYGRERLRDLISRYVKAPGEYEDILNEVYSKELLELLEEYRSYSGL